MKWLAQEQSHKCLKTNTWKFIRSISSTRKDHSVLLTNVKVSKDKYISKWVYWQNLIYVEWNSMKYCEQGQGWWSVEEKCSFMIPDSSPLFHGLVLLASSKLLQKVTILSLAGVTISAQVTKFCASSIEPPTLK